MKAHLYKSLIEKTSIGIAYHKVIADENGIPIDYQVIDANPEFKRLISNDKGVIIGQYGSELLPESLNKSSSFVSIYNTVLTTQMSKETDFYNQRDRRWYRVSILSDRPGFFATVFNDITDKDKEVTALKDLLLQTRDFVFEVDSSFSLSKVWGLDKDFCLTLSKELVGKNIAEVFEPVLATHLIEACKKSTFNQKYTLDYKCPHSETKWYKAEIVKVEVPNRSCKYIISAKDIIKASSIESELRKRTISFEKLLTNIPGITHRFLNDEHFTMEYISKETEDMLGYPASDFIYNRVRSFASVIHPNDKEAVINAIMQSKMTGETFEVSYRLIHASGNYVWVHEKGRCIPNQSGTKSIVEGVIVDITKQKKTEKKLRRLLRENERIFNGTHDAMFIVQVLGDATFRYVKVNAAYEELTGILSKEVRYKSPNEYFAPQLASMLNGKYAECVAKKETITYEVQLGSDKGRKTFLTKLSPIEEKGHVSYLVGCSKDITELQAIKQRIDYLCNRDTLTNTYNRKCFNERIGEIVQSENMPLSIIVIDINGLRQINDHYGYETGDECLIETANTLREILGHKSLIFRIGGDEFAALLPNTSKQQAGEICNSISYTAEQVMKPHIGASVSLGCATAVSKRDSLHHLLKLAIDDMNCHKMNYEPSIQSRVISTIMRVLCEKNRREEAHSNRVSFLCGNLGRVMGLDHRQISYVRLAGLLHDIGKIAIDLTILEKPFELTEKEWAQMRQHPEMGYRILNSEESTALIANYVLSHHERWDGAGYPNQLAGADIPLLSRIISICDAYDAMTSVRPYRKKPYSHQQAMDIIRQKSGTQFCPTVAECFVAMADRKSAL